MAKQSRRIPNRRIEVGRPESESLGGALEGAERTSRETMLWNPSRLSPDRIINGIKEEADFRGRDMVTNDGYMQGFVDTNRDSIVGSQFRLNAQPNWTVLKTIADKRFDEVWAEEFQEIVEERFNLAAESNSCWFDASRRMTHTGMVRMAIAGFTWTGECIATAEWIREADRPFYTAVQMVSPTRLSNPDGQMDSPTLRRGVAKDSRGKPMGYYIRNAYPNDLNDPNTFTWRFVPAAKNLIQGAPPMWNRRMVTHVSDPIQLDQTRGISEMVAILKETRMTKKFRDITLQNAVVNASYAATIESELPSDVVAAAMGAGTVTDPTNGYVGLINTYLQMLQSYLSNSNGIMVDGVKMPHLFPGTKLNARTLGTPGGIGTDFEASLLRHVAAGLGISYEEFAHDFTKTNYSSARASMLMTNRHMTARKKFVADRYSDEVYALWLEEDLNAGNLPLPRGWDSRVFYIPYGKECLTACQWIGSGRGQIDELKETQAALLRIRGGISTMESEIAQAGGDWRKNFRQLAREQKYAEELGITFDQQAQQQTPARNDSQDGQTVMNATIDDLKTMFDGVTGAIQAMPVPVVNVPEPPSPEPAPRRREKTTVTKHDSQGRIAEFIREEIDEE